MHFLENFKFEDKSSLSYLVNKTYSDLINNEYDVPSVGYSKHLTNKDKHSKRGLVAMVNKRKKLLSYLSKKNNDEYKDIIKKLNLRG